MERNRNSSRNRDDDRDDDRGRSRNRDDDRGSSRNRDDDRGSSRRDRDSAGSREDSRGGRSERTATRGRSDERSSRGGSSYSYQPRSAEDTRERASKGAQDFDRVLVPGIKMWKPNDGDNRIRILPPTWEGAKHFGLDIFVHYGVGADRGTYLCLNKMKGEPDPINDERERARREMDGDNKEDAKYLKDLEAKRRVLIYLIDRDHEKEGVQAWAMPWGVDRDIVKISVDKSSGEVLPIDHPDEGYDVEFEKSGQGIKTEYLGIAIARRSSPLGKDEWLDYAMDKPLPEQLQYFDYDHIARAFGGGASKDNDDRGRGDDRGRDRGDDRDDRRGGRDRDDDRDDEPRRRDRDDDRAPAKKQPEPAGISYADVHEMTSDELEDLIEAEGLDINPDEAKNDEDLADWICEEMDLKKPERTSRRATVAEPSSSADKLRQMRQRRGD